VYMGLCLPRSTRATSVATRPSTLPAASTTNQRRSISPALTEYVFIASPLSPAPHRARAAGHAPALDGRKKLRPGDPEADEAWSGQTGRIAKPAFPVNRCRHRKSRPAGAEGEAPLPRSRAGVIAYPVPAWLFL